MNWKTKAPHCPLWKREKKEVKGLKLWAETCVGKGVSYLCAAVRPQHHWPRTYNSLGVWTPPCEDSLVWEQHLTWRSPGAQDQFTDILGGCVIKPVLYIPKLNSLQEANKWLRRQAKMLKEKATFAPYSWPSCSGRDCCVYSVSADPWPCGSLYYV